MYMDSHRNPCADMCIDTCTGMCIDMCVGIGVDMCTCTCMRMHINSDESTYGPLLIGGVYVGPK